MAVMQWGTWHLGGELHSLLETHSVEELLESASDGSVASPAAH